MSATVEGRWFGSRPLLAASARRLAHAGGVSGLLTPGSAHLLPHVTEHITQEVSI
jgi:hypothetical protein